MPEIKIHQATFERLQRLAVPLTDTPDTVINRALDALEIKKNLPELEDNLSNKVLTFTHLDVPSLTYTKILKASIDGVPVKNLKWNAMVSIFVIRAMKHDLNFDDLCHLCQVNMVEGRMEHKGYTHYPEINISIQGMRANNACNALKAISKYLKLDLKIELEWRDKKSAAYPGRRGRLHFLFAATN